MANRSKRTDRARTAFLKVLSERCNVTAAAKAAGISTTMAYEWRDQEPEFAGEWETAEAEGSYNLHAEAWRRAHDGWEEPVFYKGKVVGQIRKYSDRMLELLLKGHMPDRFQSNNAIIGGAGNVFVGLVVVGPGGEALGQPGDGARDITPARKLNGGKGNGKD